MGYAVSTTTSRRTTPTATSTHTQNDLSKSLEKLSSGLRINRAADDAAGLAISEGLKSQVTGSRSGRPQRPGRHQRHPDR